jgi:hypothetical protein
MDKVEKSIGVGGVQSGEYIYPIHNKNVVSFQ